jgi:prenyltransferase beta subunit
MRPALVLAFLLPVTLVAQTADEKQATIKFLTGLQQPDGGFIGAPVDPKAEAKPKSTLRATSAAVRAIKYLGGTVPNRDKAAAFVLSCYDFKSGTFADTPNGAGDVMTTAVGMMAAAELFPKGARGYDSDDPLIFLGSHAKSFEERRLAVAGMEAVGGFDLAIKIWFDEVRKTANPDGTYGKGDAQARETGGVIAMFLRAGEKLPDDQRKAVIAALNAGQREDGGFGKPGEKGSDGETTYRVMRAFHLLQEKPNDVAKLKEFIARCRNSDAGYGAAPGQPSAVSGTYYAAIITKWLAE